LAPHSFPTRRSSDLLTRGLRRLLTGLLVLALGALPVMAAGGHEALLGTWIPERSPDQLLTVEGERPPLTPKAAELYEERVSSWRSEEHTSELQSRFD